MTFKVDDIVETTDGKGKIIEIEVDIENVRYLICLETDKFWPHWNFYYTHESIKSI